LRIDKRNFFSPSGAKESRDDHRLSLERCGGWRSLAGESSFGSEGTDEQSLAVADESKSGSSLSRDRKWVHALSTVDYNRTSNVHVSFLNPLQLPHTNQSPPPSPLQAPLPREGKTPSTAGTPPLAPCKFLVSQQLEKVWVHLDKPRAARGGGQASRAVRLLLQWRGPRPRRPPEEIGALERREVLGMLRGTYARSVN
jgi:hypothetical protein